MSYYARIVSERSGIVTEGPTADSAEQAARGVAMLLVKFHYPASAEEITARLIRGETLRHMSKAYSVRERV